MPPREGTALDVRVIAYYRLPQVPHANAAGEDLPEWANVRNARRQFALHDQPQLPGELGYCDVRDPAVRDSQAALARAHGISAFCYVFRWSDSAGGLDPTLAEIVFSGRPDFPFCACWETTRLHGGAGFGPDDEAREKRFAADYCAELMRRVVPVFADPRYVRIDGRPLFVVSSPDPIVDMKAVASSWRDQCMRAGAGNPYLACYGGALGADASRVGLDATIESPPLGGFPQSESERVVALAPEFAGDARNYRSYVGQLLVASRPDHTMFRTIMPGWDETARSEERPKIFVHANAETFGFWAEGAIEQTRLRFAGDERVLFVRAWNEWDAGCHLEPDARHGRRYLEALRAAVLRPPQPVPERPSWKAMEAWGTGGVAAARIVRSTPREHVSGSGPRVSVVMPAYNHERYVVSALDSVLGQSHRNLEIIVVDDGSRDATGHLLDDYAARCGTHALTVVHQANGGAHEAINHGLALATGEIIALMNSDDLYAPARLERMLQAMARRDAGLAFSDTVFIDDQDKEIPSTDPYVKQLRKSIAEAAKAPDLAYLLIYNNIAISTGNFLFRRDLLERVGGFCAMRVCHDWDFLLSASYETPLAFVDEPLYLYRLHGTNTFSGSRVQAAFELEQLLTRFFDRIASHPLLREPARAEHFLKHVRRMGLGGYIRREEGS
jgi:glycosyltransferase involved in cell wall biosynthesis